MYKVGTELRKCVGNMYTDVELLVNTGPCCGHHAAGCCCDVPTHLVRVELVSQIESNISETHGDEGRRDYQNPHFTAANGLSHYVAKGHICSVSFAKQYCLHNSCIITGNILSYTRESRPSVSLYEDQNWLVQKTATAGRTF